MLDSLNHGWAGFLLIYLLSAVGLWFGVRPKGSPVLAVPGVAILNVPVVLGVVIALALVQETVFHFFGRLPEVLAGALVVAFVPAASALTGVVLWRNKVGAFYSRGSIVVDRSPRASHRAAADATLTLAGLAVPTLDETKHFKLMGTTGTGKSTAIRELLRGALGRGDRAVIADPAGSYLQRFFDPQRGDRILNPFDERSARWDLFAEIIQPHDAEQLARSLIPDYDGTDRSWRHYARTFLTAVMRQLHRVEEHDLTKLYYLLLMAPPEELRDLLEPTPAGPFLGQDNGKFFQSVRSITNVHVAALEHLAARRRARRCR